MAIKARSEITLSLVVDVKATYRYYLLQSSTLAAPSKPTTFPPSSSWDDVEPTYTDGSTNSLYFVDCTVFCDDTFSYSEVSLSSSYEAAKAAYNKATNAQDTANNAQAGVDEIVGEIQFVTEELATLNVNAADISANVTRIETATQESIDSLNADISTLAEQVSLTMTEEEIAIRIQTELSNGTTKVTTSTGITLDDEGLTIDKEGAPTTTTLSENGMVINSSDTGDAVLTANSDGVDAKNLHATTYLIVGRNSRFEDYGDNRTGCFWIGG